MILVFGDFSIHLNKPSNPKSKTFVALTVLILFASISLFMNQLSPSLTLST